MFVFISLTCGLVLIPSSILTFKSVHITFILFISTMPVFQEHQQLISLFTYLENSLGLLISKYQLLFMNRLPLCEFTIFSLFHL
jgi:hypothetical protein